MAESTASIIPRKLAAAQVGTPSDAPSHGFPHEPQLRPYIEALVITQLASSSTRTRNCRTPKCLLSDFGPAISRTRPGDAQHTGNLLGRLAINRSRLDQVGKVGADHLGSRLCGNKDTRRRNSHLALPMGCRARVELTLTARLQSVQGVAPVGHSHHGGEDVPDMHLLPHGAPLCQDAAAAATLVPQIRREGYEARMPQSTALSAAWWSTQELNNSDCQLYVCGSFGFG